MDSGKDDGDGSRGEGSPDLPHVAGEEVLRGAGSGGVNSGDVVGQLLDADHAGFTVLGASDLLLDEHDSLLGGSFLVHLLGELVDGLLVVHASLAKPERKGSRPSFTICKIKDN